MTTRTNILLAVLIVVVLSIVPRCSRADEWTSTDTAFQLTVATLQIVDLTQTRWALDHDYTEANPLLGEHPSHARLNLSVAGAIVGHALVSYLLPQPWRRVWQVIVIAGEFGAVSGNMAMSGGVKLSLRF